MKYAFSIIAEALFGKIMMLLDQIERELFGVLRCCFSISIRTKTIQIKLKSGKRGLSKCDFAFCLMKSSVNFFRIFNWAFNFWCDVTPLRKFPRWSIFGLNFSFFLANRSENLSNQAFTFFAKWRSRATYNCTFSSKMNSKQTEKVRPTSKNSIRKRPFFPQKNEKVPKSARSNFLAKNAQMRADATFLRRKVTREYAHF